MTLFNHIIRSRFGFVLALIYVVWAGITYYQCPVMMCSIGTFAALLPWSFVVFLTMNAMSQEIISIAGFFLEYIAIPLNAVLLYFIGQFLGRYVFYDLRDPSSYGK
jgi:hypothetical protein